MGGWAPSVRMVDVDVGAHANPGRPRVRLLVLLLSLCAIGAKKIDCPLDENVTWSVKTRPGRHRTSSYRWPSHCSNLAHWYSHDSIATLLRSKHVVVVGNSVARILAITLRHMLEHTPLTTQYEGVSTLGQSVPDTDTDLATHGSETLVLKMSGKEVGRGCRVGTGGDVVNCCHAHESAAAAQRKDLFTLSYVYSGTPGTICLLNTARAWSRGSSGTSTGLRGTSTDSIHGIHGSTKSNCASSFAPDVVLFQLTSSLEHSEREVIDAIAAAVYANDRLRKRTRFIVMTRTDVSPPKGWIEHGESSQTPTTFSALSAHEAAVKRAAARHPDLVKDGTIVIMPVSMSTFNGVAAHALHHEIGSSWHFLDPGRYFLASMFLNAMRLNPTERAGLKGS